MDYKKLTGKALGCRYLLSIIGAIITGALVLVGYFIFEDIVVTKYIALLIGGLLVFNTAIGTIFRHRNYKYMINNEYIDITEGFLSIDRHIVPIERIHKLEINVGIIARMFGLADITITTAGGDVMLKMIEEKTAEEIVTKLRNRINNIVIEQKKEEQAKLLAKYTQDKMMGE